MFVGVSLNGQLAECAYTESGEYFTSHSAANAIFVDCKIERVPLLVDTCKKMHAIVPQLGIASWDVLLKVTTRLNYGKSIQEVELHGCHKWQMESRCLVKI